MAYGFRNGKDRETSDRLRCWANLSQGVGRMKTEVQGLSQRGHGEKPQGNPSNGYTLGAWVNHKPF